MRLASFDKRPARVMHPNRHALLPAVLIACCATWWLSLVWRFSVNIPNSDDFDLYLQFLLKVRNAVTLPEKLHLLFSPHGEHFVVWSRMVALAVDAVFGGLNFRALILIGNAAVLLVLLTLYSRTTSFISDRLLVFAPVVPLVLHAGYAEASLWATSALGTFWVALFALSAFRSAADRRFVPMVVFALFGAFAQGNGLLIPFILGVMVLPRRLLIGVGSALALGVSAAILQSAIAPTPGAPALHSLALNTAHYVFIFIGAPFAFGNSTIAVVAGSLEVIMAIVLITRRERATSVSTAGLLFVGGSAVTSALLRMQFGVEYPMNATRYHFLGSLFAALLYLRCLESLSNRGRFLTARRTAYVMLPIALALCAAIDLQRSPLFIFRAQRLEDSMIRWQVAKAGLEHPTPRHAHAILLSAIDAGVYSPPFHDVEALVAHPENAHQLHQTADGESFVHVRLTQTIVGPGHFVVQGIAFPEDREGVEHETFVRLVGISESYVLRATQRLTPGLRRKLGRGDLYRSGFRLVGARKDIAPGPYRIGVVIVEDGKPHDEYLTTSTIVFPPFPG